MALVRRARTVPIRSMTADQPATRLTQPLRSEPIRLTEINVVPRHLLHRLDAHQRQAIADALSDGSCQEEPYAAERRVIVADEAACRIIGSGIPQRVESRRQIGEEEGDPMRFAR